MQKQRLLHHFTTISNMEHKLLHPRIASASLLLALSLLVSATSWAGPKSYSNAITSPSKQIKATVTLRNGRPCYSLVYKNDTLVLPSSLGFVLQNRDSLTRFSLVKASISKFDETWKPVWGQFPSIRNRYTEMKLELRDLKKSRLVNLFFRTYDDGFAFRYEIPEQNGVDDIVVTSEESRVKFAGSYRCWWSWADYNTLEKTFYQTSLDSATHVAMPFTLQKSTGTYITMHEAAIDRYSTMTLKRENASTFKVNLAPWGDGTLVKCKKSLKTPWRLFVVADRPGGLIESNLVLNINEPCKLPDVSWITPMTYIGIWWEMHLGIGTWSMGPKHSATTENAIRYIDFAAAHGIKGLVIEGWNTGWENWGKKGAFDFVTPYPDFDIKKVVDYGKSKGVAIIGHHETGGDTQTYEQQLDSAFAFYKKVGIDIVKTGYAGPVTPEGENHHGQCMVEHYNKVMRTAAKYKIMLDVHEPIVLSGLSRTYPNLMTAEGVRGMEWNAWSEGNPPSHTCTLPFLRGMAGPMDYTPGIFDIDLSKYAGKRQKWNDLDNGHSAVHSTIANQLALMVVLYSPLQMAADLPENYEGNPAFKFIEQLPTSWDETRVLDASIGEYVVTARRKGKTWYIGAISNEKARELSIPLSVLTAGKKYRAVSYVDGSNAHYETNPEAIDIKTSTVTKADRLTLKLAAGGGAAIRIEEVK